jgi:tetratricopeptide (TPR) repeat protein
MHDHKWKAFPHDAAAFNYQGKALQANWSRLHIGDLEKFPSAAALRDRVSHVKTETSAKTIVIAVQDAWRAYHKGEFRRASDLGTEIGVPGFVVAIKAAVMYASYLEPDDQQSQQLLSAAAERAEQVIALLPDEPNAHYLLALALGRFSQRISILAALAQGLAPRIENALRQTLKLSSKHADAHTAMGLFNAEIIGKLGALAAGLSYGVSADKAMEHFRKALKLNPAQAIVKIEYARALQLIDKDEHAGKIEELLHQAVECTPLDAVEWLDRERAGKMSK